MGVIHHDKDTLEIKQNKVSKGVDKCQQVCYSIYRKKVKKMTKREMKVIYNDKDTNELKNVIVKGTKEADEKVEELKRLGHKEVMFTAIWK